MRRPNLLYICVGVASRAECQMKLSYAQHLEDYHLACVFGERTSGIYIDVGAGHPVADNVTCWFYLQGWRGLVVEPQPQLAALYGRVRPRDSVECCVLGRTAGEASFHAVERLHGFSTTLSEVADEAAAFGARYETRRVPMQTLAKLCAKHGLSEIDFLKIDVEGTEGDVLAGNDWSAFRPKVVLCEAVAPGSMAPSWQSWEPLLTEAGYVFALDEGLNRFYVAREQPEILARFPREKAEWLVVPHLGHTNRAPFRDDHPDHAIARELTGALFAQLPHASEDSWLSLLLHDEPDPDANLTRDGRAVILARVFGPQFPEAHAALAQVPAATRRDLYRAIAASDHFRGLLGRLAMSWDGGQILDD
jgi:FkbM family methyltransferase